MEAGGEDGDHVRRPRTLGRLYAALTIAVGLLVASGALDHRSRRRVARGQRSRLRPLPSRRVARLDADAALQQRRA